MNKTRWGKRNGMLGMFGPATKPYEIMSLDTIGGFSNNGSQKRYMHLLIDHFSRYIYISCTSGQSSRDFISLVDSVQKDNQISTLLTDQYGGLSSDEFASYCSSKNIKHIFTAVDCAFSNGLNERAGQTLVNRIRCKKNDEDSIPVRNWSTIASQCVSEYNDSPHSVTGFAPSYLLHGTSKNIIPDSLVDPPDLDTDRDIALRNTIRTHAYNKKRFDCNKNDVQFDIGDKVYIDNGNKLNRNKLESCTYRPCCYFAKNIASHI